MKHSKRNIYYHELIGLDVEVLEYPDTKLVGLKGRVVNETLKTLVIETDRKRLIRVLKEHGTFRFSTPSGVEVTVRGIRLIGRPEDRLKKIMR
ncbi:MAG: ribonuclease P protein subunit [Thermoprotei archaeon]|nr:MAG: ribonuclease P protein subunit [Thermoprotei archaeon]